MGWSGNRRSLGAVLSVIAADVLVGAPLQVNTIFGYSVAVAGRFSGLGNLAFAIFGSAAVLLAAVLTERFGDRGRQAGLIVLAAVLLIEGLPMLGADVGGILAMVPAFGITAWILAGRPVRWSTIVWFAAAAGATVVLFAFVDWARPGGQPDAPVAAGRARRRRALDDLLHQPLAPVAGELRRSRVCGLGHWSGSSSPLSRPT